ncbi:MAG: polyprenyl synthetase family protein [Chitinispirillaceae bacterium]|nr:polyprenyl synthetase family protein [Chitinispirillaceae bacterium]
MCWDACWRGGGAVRFNGIFSVWERSAAEMAGLLAGTGKAQVAALRCFGRELGIAFQIADDVLDLTGDAALLGKPSGSDLRQGLSTLPVVCYLESGGNDPSVMNVLDGARNEACLHNAVNAIRASGAIDRALEEARSRTRQAKEVPEILRVNCC